MSDVPLGLFLSGGLDSSGLAALMAPMVSDRIRTFAVGFDDAASNELPFARLAARAVGRQHHEVVVSPDDFFEALPRLIWHEDEPIAFPSSIALNFVSQLARPHVKVVLTGEGADELFLGTTGIGSPPGTSSWVDPTGPDASRRSAQAVRRCRPVVAAAPPPLRQPELPGARSRSPVGVLRELRGLLRIRSGGAPSGDRRLCGRDGPVPRAAPLLRGGPRAPRSIG